MKGLVAVARREIVERWMVLAAAALLGPLMFLIPLVPGAARFGRAAARLSTAGFSAILFCAFVSLLLGGSTIGRDLTQRRLGFYFARPLSGAAIWGGKLLGIWLLVAASAVLILLPVALFDFGSWWPAAGALRAAEAVGLFAAAVVVSLALGNVVSLSLRAKSGWILGDLALLALYAAGVWLIFVPLLQADLDSLVLRAAIVLAVGIAAALLLSGFAQLAVGRTDIARGARARFAVLWVLMLLPAAACYGYVRWLLTPGLADLTPVWIDATTPTRKASWIALAGNVRGRPGLAATFLYDLASERFVRARLGRGGGFDLCDGGTVAVWTRPPLFDREGSSEVWFCRLDGKNLLPRRSPITTRLWNLRLSADGSRLAVAQEGSISVYDLESGRVLAAAKVDSEGSGIRMAFRDPDHLLIYRTHSSGVAPAGQETGTGSVTVMDLDVPARRILPAARIEGLHKPFTLAFDDLRQRLIAWEKTGEISLWDWSSGRRTSVLGRIVSGSRHAAFLYDGRPALAEVTDGVGRLHVFSPEGRPEHLFQLGSAGSLRIGAEPEEDSLTLAISRTPAEVWASPDAYLLNLASGALRKIANHALPVAAYEHWRIPSMEPGSAVTRLLSRPDGTLLRFDPKTGSLETVRPGS